MRTIILTLVAAAAAAQAALRGGAPALGEDTVDTTYGTIQGYVTDTARAFTTIPFAKPPVGALRWQSPVAPDAWSDIKDTKTDPPGCVQHCTLPPHTCPPVQSEDCLYLNVFTPRADRLTEPLPVLFFIHGGDFYQGYSGGILYSGLDWVSNNDAIVVTTNYRLGALGFLYTGNGTDTSIEGNYGIQDQRFAMQWVQDNIAKFGGDASRVTIFGQSAGAMSVAAHLVSPLSAPLYKRAIVESNPLSIPYRTQDNYVSLARTFADKAKCRNLLTSRSKWEACLRQLDADDLLEAQLETRKDLIKWSTLERPLHAFVSWTPTLGTPDCPVQPYIGLTQNDMGGNEGKAIMIGNVQSEAWLFILEAFPKPLPAFEGSAFLDAIAGLGPAKAIKQRYPVPGGSNATDVRKWLSNISTSILFRCPIRKAMKTYAQNTGANAQPHVYYFNHLASFSKTMWGANFTFCDDVVCHGEELPFLFHPSASSLGAQYTADEDTLTTSMQAYWTSFATGGQPLPPSTGSDGGLAWPAFSEANGTMVFDTPANAMQTDPFAMECDFYDMVLPGYNFP